MPNFHSTGLTVNTISPIFSPKMSVFKIPLAKFSTLLKQYITALCLFYRSNYKQAGYK